MSNFNQKEYNKQYNKKTYKRIPLDIRNEEYAEIKEYIDSKGETVSGFIKRLIREQMERDNFESGTDTNTDTSTNTESNSTSRMNSSSNTES